MIPDIPYGTARLASLYIGSSFGAIMYGVSCLQIFNYLTAKRTRNDKKWLKSFVTVVFFNNGVSNGSDTPLLGTISAIAPCIIFLVQILIAAVVMKFLVLIGYNSTCMYNGAWSLQSQIRGTKSKYQSSFSQKIAFCYRPHSSYVGVSYVEPKDGGAFCSNYILLSLNFRKYFHKSVDPTIMNTIQNEEHMVFAQFPHSPARNDEVLPLDLENYEMSRIGPVSLNVSHESVGVKSDQLGKMRR
ncbi:hypothetical protein K435DRAFT_805424 [Dendrothele bispora CBS 962.96]|uniref:Uncharacterized protein n=1 Tax=Dendrothele bispora (strain CBS 962.96) TaxID=1314807 RepID=A0A4V4HD95_DENBC|nr:hypothetical protein K435DRAFT_805424 [Dendrothele bispora CBS 962.96]